MEKVREIFFRKVRNDIPDLEKYIDYYKWLDTSMSEMIEQLFPESARFAESVRKVVENHVLERPTVSGGRLMHFEATPPSTLLSGYYPLEMQF